MHGQQNVTTKIWMRDTSVSQKMPFKVLRTSFHPGLHSSCRINGLVLHLIQLTFKLITPFQIHTIYRSTLIRCLINPSTANYPSSTMQGFCRSSPRSRFPKEPS